MNRSVRKGQFRLPARGQMYGPDEQRTPAAEFLFLVFSDDQGFWRARCE